MIRAAIRIVRNCVCWLFGHKPMADDLSGERICVRCGTKIEK